MKVEDLIGKEFIYGNNTYTISSTKIIQDDNKKKLLLYADDLFPVSYDIVFLKETGTFIDIEI